MPVTTPAAIQETIAMPRTVHCVKLKREAEGLDFAPYPGALGKRIYEQVSREAWQAWLEQQKRLINEMRLDLSNPKARQYLAEQMQRHFFGEGADDASGYVPPSSS
jgi:Fe-S cluster biosynthesis and repair protein YggX